MPEQVKKSLVLFIYFALAVSALLVFWQVRNFSFTNYDDDVYVYENPHVLNGLSLKNISWAFTADYAANWHPLTWLSLMLDCQLFGPNAGRMHLVNLLLHLANTLLLFAVLKKMTGVLWQSAFVAAAFALHPMHVESVAWIAERKDVLSTFFLLLTIWAYVRYVEQPKVVRYLWVMVFLALGLMAKPMLVTLPFVLLLLDYWPLNRLMPQTVVLSGRQKHKAAPVANNPPTLYRIIIEKIPFFAFSVVSSVITFLVQKNSGAIADIDVLSLKGRITNVFLSYVQYISKMLWPTNLAVFYPFNAANLLFGRAAVCALLLLVISFFAVYLGRRQRYLSVGWFWFVGTLIPVIGLVHVGKQAYADRYTYIPYIGLFLMIAWGLPQLLSKFPQRKIVLGVSMVILLTTLGICAHRQTSYWKNNFTLFSHALEAIQKNYVASGNLGNAYAAIGRYSEAVNCYKQTIGFKPDYADAYLGLEFNYGRLGRYVEAIEAYKQAIKLKPYAEACNNLGVIYNGLGRYKEAPRGYNTKINANLVRACLNLGAAYDGLGRYTDEIEAYQHAIKIDPNSAEAYSNLGLAYSRLNRWSEAVDALKQAVKIKPDLAEGHYNLGYVYVVTGDKNAAMAEYNILKSLNPKSANDLLKNINNSNK